MSRNRLIGTISIYMAQHVATGRPGLCCRTAEDAIEIITRLFACGELVFPVVNCNSAHRRGGRVAECGGLLNVPRSYRFNLLNNLQMET